MNNVNMKDKYSTNSSDSINKQLKVTGNYSNASGSISGQTEELIFVDLIPILWRGKYIILACTLLFTVFGIIYALKTNESFCSNTFFIIKTGGNTGNSSLNQLASLAGVSLGNRSGIDPSDYLDKIIQDQEFIAGLYEKKWFFKDQYLYLERILEIDQDTTIANWKHVYFMSKIEAVRKRKLITINKDLKTGILSLNSNMPDPKLAYDINRYTLDFISNYIRNSIKTQAKEKKLFIEERLKEVKIDLQNAEEKLARFKERNLMSSSPKVILEEGRLLRNVTLNQEIFLQYQKQYELARVEELDNQTLIQVVKNPEIPVKRSKPNRKMIVAVSLVSGVLLGIFGAFLLHSFPFIINILNRK
jgi:uncharacterized protein involved in exopolysaccharide biosynthesis